MEIITAWRGMAGQGRALLDKAWPGMARQGFYMKYKVKVFDIFFGREK